MPSLKYFVALVLMILCAAPTRARDIYVDNLAGDDRAEGRAPGNAPALAGPVRTIGKALRLARAGDRIVVAATPEPYRESVSLFGPRNSGSEVRPLVIEGNGAVLDGSASVPPTAWEHVDGALFRFRPARLGHQQLFLNGRPAVHHPPTNNRDTLPPLAPLEWCLYDGFIYFRTDMGQVPAQYRLEYAQLQTGITLYRVHDVAIRNLVVQGYQLDGVNVFDDARNVTLTGLVCRGNGRCGISVNGASQAQIRNCGLGDNGAAQFRATEPSHAWLWNCELLDNTAPAVQNEGGALWIDGQSAASLAPVSGDSATAQHNGQRRPG